MNTPDYMEDSDEEVPASAEEKGKRANRATNMRTCSNMM